MNPAQKVIAQTVAKAAAKTFFQAFVSILALLLVPVLTSWATNLQNGGDIDVDVNLFVKIVIAATGAGIAALISLAQNSLKSS